ncbi:hypothetical protein SEPCBS119000_004618 [Sporothrix epigloea]|uniref:Dynein light intermediate chain n=1 Tax=Sporothrix epigloea TaxID=1892477 RepID=A0ABP0DT50_9PEZI
MANVHRFSTYTSVSAGSGRADNSADGVSGVGTGTGGGGGGGSKKKDLWNSMLDSVASGRKLPERNLLVFGGSVESQAEFVEALGARRSSLGNNNTVAAGADLTGLPPVANHLALGYTYYDVLDADQEGDILARISLYLLSKPSPSFSTLLRPLLTPETIPHTLVVILLDWAHPWKWLRQLREWILLLRTVLVSLSPACKELMEETMLKWRGRGRGGAWNLDGTLAASASNSSLGETSAGTGNGNSNANRNSSMGGGGGSVADALPPGPGEWEDALGLPLCVVCQNAERTDILEKTQGWKDDEFDLVLQYLRTVLVKHGASLIYTTPNTPSQLPALIHACLSVTSLVKRQPLKPEVIKRTEVVVPSNWDSWTKILVVRDGFEVEQVSNGWSRDLQRPFPVPRERQQSNGPPTDAFTMAKTSTSPAAQRVSAMDGEAVESGEYAYDGQDDIIHAREGDGATGERDGYGHDENEYDDGDGLDEDPDSAVAQYERAIHDPGLDVLAMAGQEEDVEDDDEADYAPRRSGDRRHRRRRRRQKLEVETEDVQLFLGDQLKVLDQLRQKDEAKREKEAKESRRRDPGSSALSAAAGAEDPAELISSHIGPVQFNLGGIQIDADDMLERIKNRHGYGSVSPEPPSPGGDVVGAAGGSKSAASAGDATRLAPENVDTEKMTAFFADLMNRPSQTRKT